MKEALIPWLEMWLAMTCNVFLLFCILLLVLLKGHIEIGVVGLIFAYAYPLPDALIESVQQIAESETQMVSVERCHHFTTIEVERSILSDKESEQTSIKFGKIEYKNVDMRYRLQLPTVLNQISFTIEPQQKIGIAGRTGSGKSSICLSLFRIVEIESGEILIDGINIQSIPLDSLRKQLSVIPQEPVLFAGSLRMNLDPFDEYDNQTIMQVLTQINLLQKFQQNTSKNLKSIRINQEENTEDQLEFKVLDKEIKEQGQNISVGERQLICIGRAMLRCSKILVMDEATAAIDLKTDELIQQLIKEKFQDRTVITIAHRINTIQGYDKILVLKQGKIAQFDTPEKVIECLGEENLGIKDS